MNTHNSQLTAPTTSNVIENDPSHFQYDDELIEVLIIENGNDDRDGYVELSAATKLLSPIVNIRGFNKAVLWTNLLPCHKLTRNNKNYVHVLGICKYLSMYNLSTNNQTNGVLITIKRLVSDLLMGAQSQIIDPITEIKTQLCTLQECLMTNASNGPIVSGMQMYQPNSTTNPVSYDNNTVIDSVRDVLRQESANIVSNINVSLENIKNLQIELSNKFAFSNDTMLDNFKSVKDIIIRKK
ncbi:P24 [Apocheima cinerarium nucleopolyhedrovirus]|uniref:P24 n=1 Tax=Apocheima cinerarium nucleopolyhedrovirus TaxID=307461 RepID=UPI0001D920BD|nr:P24 [Apocheima cinerarium nucleopolyhedrovirus]ADB84450.1 P24 [Apocheima cinerarium nucleopolyhedrovirus]